MKLYKQIIGLYFFLGALASIVWYYTLFQTGGQLFLYLIPNTVTAIVFSIYLLISGKYILKPEKYETPFQIMLLVQSIQFDFHGYTFKNFYFPELSLNLNLRELGVDLFTFKSFTVRIFNGYFHFDSKLIFSINLFLLALLFIHGLIIKKKGLQ